MSEAKHTPGPWTLGKGSMAIREENGQQRFIARVHIPGNLRPFDEEVQRANAHLIAAAPKLLAACERLVAHYIYNKDDTGPTGRFCEMCGEYTNAVPHYPYCLVGQAEDAIAEAKGTSK